MWQNIPSKHFGPFSFVFFRSYLAILIPFLLIPVLFLDYEKDLECKCLYVILLMALYWLFQVIPLVITAFIPLVLFPFFEIQSTKEVSPNYLSASTSLFLAGLIFAIAIEDSGLDKRIAITFLNITGPKPKCLLFGIMTVTGILSLLVSNTATTAMMIPILNGILDASPIEKETKIQENYKNGLLLAIAYSSNIGGTGLLTGTPPNLVAPALLEKIFGDDANIPFIKWALFAIPLMLVNLVLAGIWLYIFFNFSKYEKADIKNTIEGQKMSNEMAYKYATDILRKKKAELGSISFRECSIALLFLTTVLLWFTKTPKMFPGWSNLFTSVSISSSTPAFLLIILMFMIPRECCFWPFIGWNEVPRSSEALVSWNAIEKKLPWGIMFLIGGGTAMAMGTRESGLNDWLVQLFSSFIGPLDPWLVNLIFCIIMTFGTEFMSNTAVANIMVPILINLSVTMCENPLYLVVSSVICCSYAFMIPVATAPNALVFEASTLSQLQMMKCGLIMNVFCIITTTFAINIYGGLVYSFNPPPKWLEVYFLTHNNTDCLQAY